MNDSNTGFVCPECGCEDDFIIGSIVLHGNTYITADGWDWVQDAHDVEILEHAHMICNECGYSGDVSEFEM